jgi:hypothetical protein
MQVSETEIAGIKVLKPPVRRKKSEFGPNAAERRLPTGSHAEVNRKTG